MIRQTDQGFEVHIELAGLDRWLPCASKDDAEAVSRLCDLTQSYGELLRLEADGVLPLNLDRVDETITGYEAARAALLRVGYEAVAAMLGSNLAWLNGVRARIILSASS